MRWKSPKLVSSSGVSGMNVSSPGSATEWATGPRRVGPTKPVVLVPTPSIDLARKLVSSTYTPGARYSGMAHLLECSGQVELKRDGERRAGGERHVRVRVLGVGIVFDRERIGCGQRRRRAPLGDL